ncbi:hypothetical protein BDB00DRAFT_566988 [Zychaea mexicana]|uniref:uncharacterized protein n=1 Tax=Zychaea mexicana TaxID=64656 RepID=UPI0022FF1698|nr:uncharacterized protein BDB00DRAFT_566988 [Zychaea mexicana]KAI9490178.1 hypothetical protein BDB00DRAFT_566988 [Zychaea mexicana]
MNDQPRSKNVWLDDSTGIIRVVLSPRLCRRPDITQFTFSSSVSVFGAIEWTSSGEAFVRCGGFHVDHDPIREIYHWIKVMQVNKLDMRMPADDNHDGLAKSSSSSNHVLSEKFQTLFSQPSPTSPGPVSPLIKNHDSYHSNSSSFLDNFDSQEFNWSPDHPFASSTPISRLPHLANGDRGDENTHEGSPLRYPVQRVTLAEKQDMADDDDDDDEEFGFDDDSALDNFDMSAFEEKALDSRKRTLDDALND